MILKLKAYFKNIARIIILKTVSPFLRAYTNKTNIPFDENWFKDKSVAIVGGADSILKDKLGKYIDSFDVVVRINNGVEPIISQKEYTGERTDFLFHSFYVRKNDRGSSHITIDLWKKNNVKNVIYALNFECSIYSMVNFFYFLNITRNKYCFSQITKKQFIENKNISEPHSPTTGFVAINTIFKCNPRELYITGFTFFKTPHNKLYRNFKEDDLVVNPINHNPENEYKYIKGIYFSNENIKVDTTLKEIFLREKDI